MRIANVISESIVDGPGIRFVVFVQGCLHHCKGCHNPETWDFNGGREETIETLTEWMTNNPLVKGLTISGGEPFQQPNECKELAKAAKEHGMDVWVYTGYEYEDILITTTHDTEYAKAIAEFLPYIDVLVDGEFVKSLQSYDLLFRGSTNQRLIDMKKTIENNGEVVLYGETRSIKTYSNKIYESCEDFKIDSDAIPKVVSTERFIPEMFKDVSGNIKIVDPDEESGE